MSDLAESAEKDESATVESSTKILGDVVEALIVASCVDGCISATLRYVQVFFPANNWSNIGDFVRKIRSQTPIQVNLHLEMESLFNYTFATSRYFSKPSLTRPSRVGGDVQPLLQSTGIPSICGDELRCLEAT